MPWLTAHPLRHAAARAGETGPPTRPALSRAAKPDGERHCERQHEEHQTEVQNTIDIVQRSARDMFVEPGAAVQQRQQLCRESDTNFGLAISRSIRSNTPGLRQTAPTTNTRKIAEMTNRRPYSQNAGVA